MTFLGTTSPFYGGAQVKDPANVIPTSGAPSTVPKVRLGTLAVDKTAAILYGAVSHTGGGTTWAILGGGTGAVATLTGGSGGAISPVAGNITLAGTANQITTTGTAGTITLSLPSSVILPGSLQAGAFTQAGTVNMNVGAVTAATNIGTGAAVQTVIIGSSNTTSSTQIVGGTTSFSVSTAGGGNLVGPLGVSGSLTFGTSGIGLVFASGPNARVGDVTLVSGTATVANTTITANSKIFPAHKASNASTALGNYTYVLNAGVGFTINSLNPATPGSVLTTDASTVSYMIVETF